MLLVPLFPLVKVEAKRASARFPDELVDTVYRPWIFLDTLGVRAEQFRESAFPLSGGDFCFLGVPAQEAGERRAPFCIRKENGGYHNTSTFSREILLVQEREGKRNLHFYVHKISPKGRNVYKFEPELKNPSPFGEGFLQLHFFLFLFL